MRRLLVSTLSLILLTGCASGFDRRELRERLHAGPVRIDDADIARALQARPRLSLPLRLAIHVADMDTDVAGPWRTEDHDAALAWGATLRTRGVVSAVHLVPRMLLTPGPDALRQVRLAAARTGADAVLILRSASATDRWENPGAALYLTLLGMYVVPASHADALCLLEGVLLDVRSGFVYAATQSEGEGSHFAPLIMVDPAAAARQARSEALAAFGPRFVDHVQGLAIASAVATGRPAARSEYSVR